MKLLSKVASLVLLCAIARADDNAFFKIGPLALNIPLKTAQATYMFDFNAKQNLVGGETPVITLWDKVEGTVGAVTSLQGQGSPFVGGNIKLENVIEKYVSLGNISIGGFGGYNFNENKAIYGLKASTQLW